MDYTKRGDLSIDIKSAMGKLAKISYNILQCMCGYVQRLLKQYLMIPSNSNNHEAQPFRDTKRKTHMKPETYKQKRTTILEPLGNKADLLARNSSPIQTQLQITNICLVHKGVLYLFCETSQ